MAATAEGATGFNLYSLLVAILGAVILLFVVGLVQSYGQVIKFGK
jgi:uncharacterized membrane protein YeaQ/YmgE (transglycosylase-associated protein family)